MPPRRLQRQQICCLHDLSGLAVATLRHLLFYPGGLQRFALVRVEAFDSRYSLIFDDADWRNAGSRRRTVNMHGARAAGGDSASEFRPFELEFIPDHPQQRCVILARRFDGLTIKIEFGHDANSP